MVACRLTCGSVFLLDWDGDLTAPFPALLLESRASAPLWEMLEVRAIVDVVQQYALAPPILNLGGNYAAEINADL